MSHFSTLKILVKDLATARRVAAKRGWTVEKVATHKNRYSGETLTDCHEFRDASGKVMLVVGRDGGVTHDSFYMSRADDAHKFLVDYSAAYITKTAAEEGASITNLGYDAQNNLVLEVVYA